MKRLYVHKVLVLLVSLVAAFSSFREAYALPIQFVYPFPGQIVAPGDDMFVRWSKDADLISVTDTIDFSLSPTMRPFGTGENIDLGRRSSTSTGVHLKIPSNILDLSQNVSTFQLLAKIKNGTVYYSDIFKIAKGVATSTVLVDRSTSPFNPKCSIDKDLIPPNGTVMFTPTPPYQGILDFKYTQFGYRWIGETSLKSTGPVALSFIYPGQYTVVLEADPHNGAIYQVECPKVSVSNNAAGATNMGGAYLFPFNSSTTKPFIPREVSTVLVTPPTGCLNLGQNLSYGYSDATTIKKNGVIYALQEFLFSKGYLDVEPTGYFGAKTKLAVQNFQSDFDIEPTGFVGKVTRGKIKILSCL